MWSRGTRPARCGWLHAQPAAKLRADAAWTRAPMAETDPFDTLLQIAGGSCVPRCLHVVANLGVADALADTPQTAAALAAATGADGAALDRVLRLLSAYGVFEHRKGLIAHTPASLLLRGDHPQSMRPLARMFGLPAIWAAMGKL